MIRMPVLCSLYHTDHVIKGGKTKVHICNTTLHTIKEVASRHTVGL